MDRPAVRVDARLRETLFAPLQLESRVLDAWIELDGPVRAELALRDTPGRPTGVAWRRLRGLDRLELARAARPPRYPPGPVSQRVPVVLLRRRRDLQGGRSMRLCMALRDEATGAARGLSEAR